MIGTRSIDRSAERNIYMATVLIIVAVTLAVREPAFFISSIDWDEGVYIIVAQRWLLGGLPYVAVWDQHPPGLPALFAVVQNIIPDPVLGARLAAAGAVIMTALLIHRFCTRYANQAGAGLVSALLYIVCVSRWLGLAANTEVFDNACVSFAAYLLYGATRRSSTSLARAVVAATVLGVGLQIKYVVFPEAVLLCLGYLLATYQQNRNIRAMVLAAGLLILMGCLPTGIAILYFWVHGALWLFLDANIGSNIAYLDIVPTVSAIVRFSAGGIAPIFGAILMIGYEMARCAQWRRTWTTGWSPQAWILLWGVAAMANISLPLKFFTHYYFALYPPVCLAGGLSLFAMARGRTKNLAFGLTVLFVTAIPFCVVGDKRAARGAEADAPREVAEFLQQVGTPDLNVFVYDYHPVVYALAQLRPRTSYVLGSELSQYSHSAQVDGAAEVRRIMDTSPDFVVLRVRLPGEPVPVALDKLVSRRLASYHLACEVVDGADMAKVRVYARLPPALHCCPSQDLSSK